MEAVARFAQDPWESIVIAKQQEVSSPHFKSLLQIDTGTYAMRNKYLLEALYKVGRSFAEPMRGLHKLYVWIFVGNHQVGRLLYDLKGVEGGAANRTYLPMDSNLTKMISTSPSEQVSDPAVASTSGLSSRRSGWASDPENPRLSIHYEFQGRDMAPTNVFTTFLDAMVTAAQYDGNEDGARLTAFSADERVSMRVSSILLTWTDLKKALMVLWRFVIVNYVNPDLMIWEDLIFTIYDEDTLFLGQGSMAYSAKTAPAASEAKS